MVHGVTCLTCWLYRAVYTQCLWTLVQVRCLDLTDIGVAANVEQRLQPFNTGHFLCWHVAPCYFLLIVMETCLFIGWHGDLLYFGFTMGEH